MQQLSEEEKRQRMMAMAMRSGMTPGMDGKPQEFAAMAQQAPEEFAPISMEAMRYEGSTPSFANMKAASDAGKPTAENPNADIIATHGYEGNSVGGDASPSQAPSSNIPMETRGNTTTMQMPTALKKKRWPWQ